MTYATYIDAWRARWQHDAQMRAEAAHGAHGAARRVAAFLHERYGARRVWLIGSLARGEFARASDLDLVVEGIAPETFFRAGAEAEREAGALNVDLIPYEDASPALLEEIAREGVPLA